MRKIKIGVLGMGPRGIWYGTKEFLRADPRAEIVAFCDRDPRALDYAARETGVACRHYTDLAAMLADPEVEAVVNCTDDPDHASTAIPILA